MATPTKTRTPSGEIDVFVSRSIGKIELSETGDRTAVEAAFMLIARDAESGEYHFVVPSSILHGVSDLRFDISVVVSPVPFDWANAPTVNDA